MASIAKERKEELIKIKLSVIIQKSASNPRFEGVTITNVEISPDTAVALIHYAVFGTDRNISDVTKALNAAAGFFQSKLAHTLKTRNTPRLKFIYDTGFDHTNRIESILKGLHLPKEDE